MTSDSKLVALCVVLGLVTGCGSRVEIDDPRADGATDVAATDAGTEARDGGASPDVGTADDGGRPVDAGDEPMPVDVQPCGGAADCWETSIGTPPCALATHAEDFSSGNYNVHRYAGTLWGETPTQLRVAATGGDWEPVVVLRADGATWFDGELGIADDVAVVEVSGGSEIVVTVSETTAVQIFVTSRSALDSDFEQRVPTSATYSLTVESDCGGDRVECVANGNTIREPACGWLHHVGRRVVPALEGSRDERLTAAARVAWWSLKEGVMFLDNPIVYSNCNFPSGDDRIGPLETCVEGRAWQVGLSAIQVPNYPPGDVEAGATTLYPDTTIEDLLATTAAEAAVDPATAEAIVDSTGTLRKSWLLRNSAIGFSFQVGTVTRECIDDTRSWCFGTGWDATRMFAPDRAGATQAISDIRAMLDTIAP